MALIVYDPVIILKLNNHIEDTKVSELFTKHNAENVY